MRRFHSYGPVQSTKHYCVKRASLVEQCVANLRGDVENEGHYFTIWAARQTGKTWLMREARRVLEEQYSEKFDVFVWSAESLRDMPYMPENPVDPNHLPRGFWEAIQNDFPGEPVVENWKEFLSLFSRQKGLWKRPLILLIDEIDTLPPDFLSQLVSQFRTMYLHRDQYQLHGLALVGVRAVVGVESRTGSPFNIQRSLRVPNLKFEEVEEMFQQYQAESGQPVEPEVIQSVFALTKGQPGLVGWFGELLTETYNPGKEHPIHKEIWEEVERKALFVEPNNTMMNLISKARDPHYQEMLFSLFAKAEIPFAFSNPQHNYLYMHGILDHDTVTQSDGNKQEICRFSSPFVQRCLFEALSDELHGIRKPEALPLEATDDPELFLGGERIDLLGLIRRYRGYLDRLKTRGRSPWNAQPRNTNLNITEAVGHFHLYHWMQMAFGSDCVIAPEFPTGNGRVDLWLEFEGNRAIVEIKSFTNLRQLRLAKTQAARYARQLQLDQVMLVVFSPFLDETSSQSLCSADDIEGVRVFVEAIGMGQ